MMGKRLTRNQKMLLGAAVVVLLAGVVLGVFGFKEKKRQVTPPPVQPLVQQVTPKKKVTPKTTPVKKDTVPMVTGTVRDTAGVPLPDVVVSDCYSCVKTDANGVYRLPINKAARFIYYTVPAYCEVPTHSETDHTALFYQPYSSKQKVYDFTLTRLPGGKETDFHLLVFGDPQVTNSFNPYYTDASDNRVKKSDVMRFTDETMADVRRTIAALPVGTPVYGLSMGDDVQYYGGYNADLERQLREAIGSSRARVFSVIGNHDQDGKAAYKAKWEETWGPTDYSFDRGDVHFVCFNNVHFVKGSYYSPGELTAAQMAWLRSDLRLVSSEKKVILCYHIPLTFGNSPMKGAVSLGLEAEPGHYRSSRLLQILQLTRRFRGGTELFCGHTHFAINHEISIGEKTVREHCHAAACGNIWQANINICGTPNGYYVYLFRGTLLANSYYKGTFWSREKQMTLFQADRDFNGESYSADWSLAKEKRALVANVFNADSRWKVVAIENGKETEMRRISHTGQDAFAVGYFKKYIECAPVRFVSKQNGYLIMNHLYYYEPQNPDARITVKAYDPYGNVYEASTTSVVTEPFHNYAHYY